jgi:hypothetical protein
VTNLEVPAAQPLSLVALVTSPTLVLPNKISER